MCFMTFTGEKSGDIFDGFGDGYDGNAGDGGVNDKENERINSRAITFGSMLITPKVYNELTPCPPCLIINTIAIGLTTGVALPMLATPYLAHYVLINQEAAGSAAKNRLPVVNNVLEFSALGWEGSKPARPVIAMCAAIQMLVSFGAMYAVLWGRERMFSTLELDAELARRLVAEAQTSSSLKQKILDFLRKIPLINGVVPESPENERVA
uniref:Uncharacterized protein n=1 Tax=Caenorhabditis japonica TaxID=281687 RepID=A0A8R1DXS6_CAEJA